MRTTTLLPFLLSTCLLVSSAQAHHRSNPNALPADALASYAFQGDRCDGLVTFDRFGRIIATAGEPLRDHYARLGSQDAARVQALLRRARHAPGVRQARPVRGMSFQKVELRDRSYVRPYWASDDSARRALPRAILRLANALRSLAVRHFPHVRALRC